MKDYYDENYNLYEVMEKKDFINHRIWKVAYDSSFDVIYIFKAKMTPNNHKRQSDAHSSMISTYSKGKSRDNNQRTTGVVF